MNRVTRHFRSGGVALLTFLGLMAGPGPLFSQDPVPSQESAFVVPGTVIDAEDGTPLQYAVVGIPELGAWALSEADGSFSLEVAAPGIYRLVVVKRGWYLADADVTLMEPSPLEVNLYEEQDDDAVGPGRLVGRVFDAGSGRAVSGATVRITPTNQEARTDSRGRFMISGISSGAILVEVERRGSVLRTDTLATFPGLTLAAEIGIPAEPAERPQVTVEVWPRYLESVGFYRRAEFRTGNRFGRKLLEEQRAVRFSDVVQRAVPALRAETGRFGQRVITARGSGGNRCAMGIYLDNSPMPGFDIDTYPVDRVEAFETYERTEVPLEYSHPCGVILIWSRRPD